ncbi:calcipressin-2-like [Styela clava]|uniref:calcipressin-2-like n=1 Tax=Styela clava TaxID=7725 RepID=UPI00193A901E|nr:calcipressin-2-like [Styela clava]
MLPDTKDISKREAHNGCASAELLLKELDVEDLPSSVFVCDVPNMVFCEEDVKEEFQNLFSHLNPTNFIYLQNFRRVKVYFESSMNAAQARVSLHGYEYRNQTIKIYFAQIQSSSDDESSDSLLPPKPDRLFLISPPASPPVGWEPIPESEPVINYHLLSAIASLQPGESHEIHPGTLSTPSVVVHTCEEDEAGSSVGQPKLKIQQTRRPDAPS